MAKVSLIGLLAVGIMGCTAQNSIDSKVGDSVDLGTSQESVNSKVFIKRQELKITEPHSNVCLYNDGNKLYFCEESHKVKEGCNYDHGYAGKCYNTLPSSDSNLWKLARIPPNSEDNPDVRVVLKNPGKWCFHYPQKTAKFGYSALLYK